MLWVKIKGDKIKTTAFMITKNFIFKGKSRQIIKQSFDASLKKKHYL